MIDYGLGPVRNELERDRVAKTIRELMTPCNFQWWAIRDAWTIREAACIFYGVEPSVVAGIGSLYWTKKEKKLLVYGDWEIFSEVVSLGGHIDQIIQDMMKSHAAGKLSTIDRWVDGETLIDPAEAVSWALSKRYKVHDDIACLGKQEQSMEEEPPAVDRIRTEKQAFEAQVKEQALIFAGQQMAQGRRMTRRELRVALLKSGFRDADISDRLLDRIWKGMPANSKNRGGRPRNCA